MLQKRNQVAICHNCLLQACSHKSMIQPSEMRRGYRKLPLDGAVDGTCLTLLRMFSLNHSCAKVFSESKILNVPILNLQSQHANALVYTGLKAISGLDLIGMEISSEHTFSIREALPFRNK